MNRAHDCGLDPDVLSPEGLAFANCFERWNEPPPTEHNTQFQLEGDSRPERSVDLYLNVGHKSSLICAMDNGTVVGVRGLSWGGYHLAEYVRKKYEITASEAQAIIESKAFVLLNEEGAAYDQIVFSTTICESLRTLSRDVQLSILEFQREFNAVPRELFVSGGLGRIQNMNAFLTQVLDLPVNSAHLITGRYALGPTVGSQMNERADTIYGVALGLAIEGLKKPRNPPVTFLRGELQKQNKKTQEFFVRWGSLLRTAAVGFVVFLIYSLGREQLASDLNDKAAEVLKTQAKAVAHLNSKQASEAGVQKFVKEQSKRTQELRLAQRLSKMPSALELLRRISEAVPSRGGTHLQIQRFSVHENRVEMEGFVSQANELQSLKNSLQGMAVGGKVNNLPRNPTVPAGQLAFAVSFDVERLGREKGSKESPAQGVSK